MPTLPSLPDEAVLMDVFAAHPAGVRPLLQLHEELLRGPSPFSVAERELIAAYTSGLNDCAYCHGVHTATAEAFGLPSGVLEAALTDLDSAPVDERLKPVLRYVATLTRTPARITPADAEPVYAAGWSEQALHDAIMVCGLFNLMNRMVDGHGIRAGADYYPVSGQRLKERGYVGLGDLLPQ
ncbi:MAG TPA: carboxymuconolactone decarboxylase family protein [Mycobacteriales bacterium]|nr:carboxymuconolactone decarboxylase family protein [Mycobacteriales bacterium]